MDELAQETTTTDLTPERERELQRDVWQMIWGISDRCDGLTLRSVGGVGGGGKTHDVRPASRFR